MSIKNTLATHFESFSKELPSQAAKVKEELDWLITNMDSFDQGDKHFEIESDISKLSLERIRTSSETLTMLFRTSEYEWPRMREMGNTRGLYDLTDELIGLYEAEGVFLEVNLFPHGYRVYLEFILYLSN